MKRLGQIIKKPHYGWVTLAATFFVFSCDSISERLIPYLIPSMEAELNLSHGPMGNIVAAYFVAFATMNPVWGILADKIGPRRVILIGQALIITGLTGMGFIQSFTAGLSLYMLCGIGAASQVIAAVALASRWFVTSRRGRANGILMSAVGVTVLTMGFVVPLILADYSWRWSWWLFAIVVTAISIFCWHLLVDNPEEKDLTPIGTDEKETPPPREENKGNPEPEESRVTIKDIMKRRITWNLAGIFFVWAIGYVVFATFGVAYLEEVGWAAKEASRVFATWGALSIPSAIVWGIFADRLIKKHVFLIMIAIQATGMFVFLGDSPLAHYAGASMIGFTYMGIFVTMASALGDYYEPKIIGTVFGVITGICGAGLAVGPAIGGHLADTTGTLHTAFLFGLGALVLSFILTLTLKKPSERPGPITNKQ
jgi:sugar phosphate permease